MKVRHAQDIDAERFEGDWDWAVATIRLRSLTDFESATETPIYDGVLRLPGGQATIGDADNELVLNDLAELTQVRVFAIGVSTDSAIEVRVDLAPLTS